MILDQPVCNRLDGLAASSSFLEVDFLGFFWHQWNDEIFVKVQWPIEKTPRIIWDALQDYGRIEWKRMLKDLEKAPDVAYQDILKDF